MVRRETNLNAIVATKAYPRKAPRHTLQDRCSDRAPTFGIGSRAPQRTWGLRAPARSLRGTQRDPPRAHGRPRIQDIHRDTPTSTSRAAQLRPQIGCTSLIGNYDTPYMKMR